MKSKRLIVFDKINQSYYPTIREYHFLGSCHYFVEAVPDAPEEYHLIAKAANKYYGLVALNDEKT